MLKTENKAEASTSALGSGHCQVCAPGHVGQGCWSHHLVFLSVVISFWNSANIESCIPYTIP